jgi:hypothetical protein
MRTLRANGEAGADRRIIMAKYSAATGAGTPQPVKSKAT